MGFVVQDIKWLSLPLLVVCENAAGSQDGVDAEAGF